MKREKMVLKKDCIKTIPSLHFSTLEKGRKKD